MMQLAKVLEKLSEKLFGWVESFVIMLPNLLVAVLVLALAVPLSRWVRGLCLRLLTRMTRNVPIADLAASVVRGLLLLLATFTALQLLQLDKTVTSLVAGVGVAGLALGFAFQDIASNFISGFMMAVSRPFEVGDLVELREHQGRILSMSMRDIEVETVDGRSVLIPNREVFQNAIVNFTRTPSRRLELTVGIDYAEDLTHVRALMIEALSALPGREAAEPVEVLFEEFLDFTIKATALIWLSAADELHYRRSRSAAVIAIKQALDAAGVVLPVPERQLELGPEFARGTLTRVR